MRLAERGKYMHSLERVFKAAKQIQGLFPCHNESFRYAATMTESISLMVKMASPHLWSNELEKV